jgi:hypothetical protein
MQNNSTKNYGYALQFEHTAQETINKEIINIQGAVT